MSKIVPSHCSPDDSPDIWKSDGICPDCAKELLSLVCALRARIAELEHDRNNLLCALQEVKSITSKVLNLNGTHKET